jgi:hypothetical protein
MSPAMTALSSVGISHSVMILAVLFVVAAVCIGMYWKVILPGAIMIGVGLLFVGTSDTTDTTEVKPEVKQEVMTEDHMSFMEDCMGLADYPRSKCDKLWEERKVEEKELERMAPVIEKSAEKSVDFKPVSEVKLIDVDNTEYKVRRAAALSKPNAVVMQATYR